MILYNMYIDLSEIQGFSLIEVPMGNGQHEQKVDKLQILNPNCMYMITGLFLTKFVSVIQYVYMYHHRANNNIGPYGETNMFWDIFALNYWTFQSETWMEYSLNCPL